jgi:hypothetical protein
VEVEVGEAVTDEAIEVPRFETLEAAKEAFKTPEYLEKKRRAIRDHYEDRLKYIEEHKKSSMRPILDTLATYTSGYLYDALSYLDPLAGMSSPEYYREKVREAEYDIDKREKFIEEHPKWFLQKKYYNDDQFGHKRALEKLGKKGENVSILVMDLFSKVMPLALKAKCTNADEFNETLEQSPKAEDHGVSVASVAVDTDIGVAPESTFRATTVRNYLPYVSSPMDHPPYSTDYYIDFSGDSIEHHHLVAIDFYLREKGAKFAVKMSETQYHIVDAADKELPSEQIINMSISYLDNIGENRNHAQPKERLVKLIGFASMVLRFVDAGKLIVWSAGNEAMVQGASHSYTLMKALNSFRPFSFINSLALNQDGTTLSNFTNQPGNHSISEYSLAAPGKQVPAMRLDGTIEKVNGTSFSAPYISGAAALLRSNYPDVPMGLITKSLLFMAAPVVMKPNPSRGGETPYVIRSARAGSIKPDAPYKYFSLKGERDIFVTQGMLDRGRAKYGVGIINISGAATFLELYKTNPEFVKKQFPGFI